MAKNLDLKIEPLGADSIRVSWTDIKRKEDWGLMGNIAFGVAVIVGFLAMIPISMSGGGIIIPIWLFAIIGTLIFMRMNKKKPNSVTFGRKTTTHNGREIPTDRISRIEYGLETQLTGAKTKTAFQTDQDDPQTLIRMWVDDSYAHNISLNSWQNQVNHEIRDTLARALDEVRKGKAKEERAEKFGDQGDLGMPDY